MQRHLDESESSDKPGPSSSSSKIQKTAEGRHDDERHDVCADMTEESPHRARIHDYWALGPDLSAEDAIREFGPIVRRSQDNSLRQFKTTLCLFEFLMSYDR